MSLSQRQWQKLQLPQWADHPNAQWDHSTLEGWDSTKRLKLVIDSDLIDADLTDFPVAIFLSTSCGIGAIDASVVFDELTSDANRFKIAVTTADGVTQCYVEIEVWDDANETAVLHVKVPFISADQDTELYLYFDSDQPDNTDYVGDTGDAAAQAVWDSNFDAVWHMAQDPDGDAADSILDSTANGNDGTPSGTMTAADLVDGLNGAKAIDFDGTDDRINITDYKAIGGSQNRTSEIVFKVPTMTTTIRRLLSWGDDTTAGQKWHMRLQKSDESPAGALRQEVASANVQDSVGGLDDDDWHYGAATLDGATQGDVSLNVDGVEMTETYTSPGQAVNTDITGRDVKIGSGYGVTWENCDGLIGEVRISDTNRSAAWVKATYHSLFDTLVTVEETWLYGWGKKRLQITIDSSLIDGDLTDFPLTIHLGADSGLLSFDALKVFTELSDSDRLKIAITANDHQAQQYIEIETWDSDAAQAILHTKVASILAAADTQLFLYFDSEHADNTTYVGDTGDAAAQAVWDSDFKLVMHMAQDPTGGAGCILDSTSNANNGSPEDGMASDDLLSGTHGPELDFSGADWVIRIAHDSTIDIGDEDWTIESLFNRGASADYEMLIGKGYGAGAGDKWFMAGLMNTGTAKLWVDDGTLVPAVATTSAYDDGSYHHVAFMRDSVTNKLKVSIDAGAEAVEATDTAGDNQNTDDLIIGCRGDEDASYYYAGTIGEVRISKTLRPAAWLKATYHSLFDTLIAIVDDTVIVFALDITVEVGTASITWSVPAATISVSALAGTPAQIAWSVLAAAVGVGADVTTPEIIWSALEAAITQNLNAIGIMSKPVVSAKGPSITVTVKAPSATVTFVKPSITATGKSPNITVTGKGPSATVTAKGE